MTKACAAVHEERKHKMAASVGHSCARHDGLFGGGPGEDIMWQRPVLYYLPDQGLLHINRGS